MVKAGYMRNISIAVLVIIFGCLASPSIYALTCNGHMVNGYRSSDYGYQRFSQMSVKFEACKWYIPNQICNEVFLDGQKKTAYWAESSFNFFKPSGSFTPKTGHLTFKMREASSTASPNEDERWFDGFCR